MGYHSGCGITVHPGGPTLVSTPTYSPDGTQILAGTPAEHAAKAWDAMTGLNLLTMPVESGGTGGVSFRPDGKRLAVGVLSGVYVFVLPMDDLVALARSRLTRSLTVEECQQYLHLATCPREP